MKQKEFPVNPAALHLGVLLLQKNGELFNFPQKMNETKFAEIYNKFCEKLDDAYSSSYNGMYYDGLSDKYYFPFNEKYAIACSNASLFYSKIKDVTYEFKGNFAKFVAHYDNIETILSEIFPQRFDSVVKCLRLDSRKGEIFESKHRFLSFELETYLERIPIEESKKLMDAIKFAFNVE